jgi:glucose/arabinose dehydrogenase
MPGRTNGLSTSNKENGRRRTSRFLAVLGVLAMAVAGAVWLLPVSVPLPKAFAETDRQLEQQMLARTKAPTGFKLSLFASNVDNARLMVETSTGDLIVSSRKQTVHLVRGDKNGDGRADGVKPLLTGLNQPHGLLLDDGWLYIAEEHQVSRISFDAKRGAVSGQREIVLSGLPDDGGHSTRTIKKGPDGWIYVAIGSSCNVCIERHPWRAALIRFQPNAPKNTKPEIVATGLRNTVGFDWQPKTNALFGVDNGRDWLGDDFPPCELNRIEAGKFYGWPYRNGMNVPDPDFGNQFNGQAEPPVLGFDAHVAPLSIHFLRHQKTPTLNGLALVAQHGSWNRSVKQGYRIVAVRFDATGKATREPFLSGFLHKGKVIGRPVDVLERRDGSILISDDYADAIWMLKPSAL